MYNTINSSIDNSKIPDKENLEFITLPRDVLKWIQSLDLTHSIKNIKKDFNNGFLIAQILSRYYPINDFSLDKKRDNWIIIFKYLHEIKDFNFNNERFENYINNQNDEISNLIILLYQRLTKRKIRLLEGKRYKTDQDNINRSYLLKENGEIELIRKDCENKVKKSEDLLNTSKINNPNINNYQIKTTNVIMNGESKRINNSISDFSEKKFNPKVSETKVFERSTKILRLSKEAMNTLNPSPSKSPNRKSVGINKQEIEKSELRMNLSELISMQEKKEDDIKKHSKVKNPFEWFELNLKNKIIAENNIILTKFSIENSFFYDFFKNIKFIDIENLKFVMDDIIKMIDEHYNFISEQVNDYASIFLLIFESYISLDLEDEKFLIMHNYMKIFFLKSLKNRSDEIFYIFKNILIKKIFEAMKNIENRDKLYHLCEMVYKILDPSFEQQLDFFKIFKENLLENEEILYESFSILHDLLPLYSENLIDICLYYILSGIMQPSSDIRYYSLYILHKYVQKNVNFFYNFESKLKKLSISENDRENNLLIIRMSILYLININENKNKPKENFKKINFFTFDHKIDEDSANITLNNELSMGNNIIKNILKRFTGDALFMLIACSYIAEHLNDNFELNKIFLFFLFQTNENILNYIFYEGTELNEDIIKLQQFTKFRLKPEIYKFKDWSYHFLFQGFSSNIQDGQIKNINSLLSEKEYKFLEFTISNGFNPTHGEVWKNSFKFSNLILLDCNDNLKSDRALKILESFLFFEPIQKQILEDIYDSLYDLIIKLQEMNDLNNKKCLEILNSRLKSWTQNTRSTSILRDGLRKLLDLIKKNSKNNLNFLNNNNSYIQTQ